MQATAAAVQAFLPATRGATRPAGRRASTLRLVQQQQRQMVVLRALGDSTDKASKGGIKREEEPEEYWTSQAERDGKSPFQDPLAQIGILAILFPFIFLGVAIAVGWVELP